MAERFDGTGINMKCRVSFIVFSILISFLIIFIPQRDMNAIGTVVSDDITNNTTWNVSGSPFIITKIIEISSAAQLTIEPGVIILFDREAGFEVKGVLNANGKASSQITFSANTDTPVRGYWDKINIRGSNAYTIFNYCIIRYGTFGLNCYSSFTIITNCTISHNYDTGINFHPSVTNLVVDNNYLYDNGFGIQCWDCSPTIANNIIHHSNPFDGLFSTSGTPTILNTKIWSSHRSGILANSGGRPTIINCTINDSGRQDLNVGADSCVTLINTSFNKSKVAFMGEAPQIIVKWYLNVKVVNSTNYPIPSVDLRISDNENGTFSNEYRTDRNGWANCMILTEYSATLDTHTYYTPYSILAIKNNKMENETIELSISRTIKMVLDITFSPIPITNIQPVTTHNLTPRLSWETPQISNNGLTYHISLWNGSNSFGTNIFYNKETNATSYQILNKLAYGEMYYLEIYVEEESGAVSVPASHNINVVNHPPSTPGINITIRHPKTTDNLTCVIDRVSIDIDIDPVDTITYTYKWYKNNLLQPEFAVEHTTLLSYTIPANVTLKDEVWKCVVTPYDSINEGQNSSVEVKIENSGPRVSKQVDSIEIESGKSVYLELFNIFSDDDNDTLIYYVMENNHIDVFILQENGVAIIIPQINWVGVEKITFCANDSSLNASTNTEIIVKRTENKYNTELNDDQDYDNDGLADAWEVHHFGNLDQIKNDDFDHDNFTNYDEFINDTDPKNPYDYPNKVRPGDESVDNFVLIIVLILILIFIIVLIIIIVKSGGSEDFEVTEDLYQKDERRNL